MVVSGVTIKWSTNPILSVEVYQKEKKNQFFQLD